MQTKAPNPARLHEMGTPHFIPAPTYLSPCGEVFPNALVAYAHWIMCILCHVLMACDDCGATGDQPHDESVEH